MLTFYSSTPAAEAVKVASLDSRIILACGLVIMGSLLAFDVRGISTKIRRDSSGFTPWGKKRDGWKGPNPARAVGAFFLLGGIVALVSVALNP